MTIRWALVSPGAHAETLLAPAIGAAEGARLVAVCSRDQERAEAFANRHGAQAAYASVEDLVADDRVDAVLIASPNFLHAPYTTTAARAGKHVLVEKPMAVTVLVWKLPCRPVSRLIKSTRSLSPWACRRWSLKNSPPCTQLSKPTIGV